MSAPARDRFVAGLVLGAGGSTRLGRPKQLLPYGEGTLLGHVVALAREWQALGATPRDIARVFSTFNAAAEAFRKESEAHGG